MSDKQQQEQDQALRAYAEKVWRAGGGSPENFEEAWPDLEQDLRHTLREAERRRAPRSRPVGFVPRF